MGFKVVGRTAEAPLMPLSLQNIKGKKVADPPMQSPFLISSFFQLYSQTLSPSVKFPLRTPALHLRADSYSVGSLLSP